MSNVGIEPATSSVVRVFLPLHQIGLHTVQQGNVQRTKIQLEYIVNLYHWTGKTYFNLK
jgi:hypothetical protein